MALDSPITFTSSLTDTPINSGGMSLLIEAAAEDDKDEAPDVDGGVIFLETGGLCDPDLRIGLSPLNHFEKKEGLPPAALEDDGDGVLARAPSSIGFWS